jgi:polysaccharide pyruvyl transferase CsaB
MEELSGAVLGNILRYFDLSGKERERICAMSREIVENGYSASEMARETEFIYRLCVSDFKKNHGFNEQKPLKIAICGYYGHGNFGDEAILRSILSCIEKAVCENESSPRKEADIRIISLKNPFKTARDLFGADLFIFGGGSLLQNLTSDRSLLCYLIIILASSFLCGPKLMLANGFGPIKDGILSKNAYFSLISVALRGFDLISVRDDASLFAIKEILPNRKIIKIEDPALIELQYINQRLINVSASASGKKYFAYFCNLRACSELKIPPSKLIFAIKKLRNEQKRECVIVVLNPAEDLKLAKAIAVGSDSKIFVPKGSEALCSLLRKCEFAISQRYHGALYSIYSAVPTFVLSDDPKLISLCAEMGAVKLTFDNLSDIKRKIFEAELHDLPRMNDDKIVAILKKYLK